MKFKSKIDLWFHILAIGPTAISVWLAYDSIVINNFTTWFPIHTLILTSLFVLPFYFNTYYLLDTDRLVVNSGMLKTIK